MIYFDEAGNSGSNLLDKDQPTFVLASHDFNREETHILLDPLYSISNADELHFKGLKKFSKFQNALIDLFDNPLIDEDRIYHYLAHKKFMVGIHLVDQLIEPVLLESGIDIYQYGINLASANLLHIFGEVVWKEEYDKACILFVKWVRSGLKSDRVEFYKCIEYLYNSTNLNYRDLLSMILLSTEHLDTIEGAFTKYTLDATLTCFVVHCMFWTNKYKEPFDVVFDNSKQIEYWKEMVKFLTDSVPDAEVGYGSRKYKYPLLIKSLRTEDSKVNPELQLSDIIASAINHVGIQWAQRRNDEFANRLVKTRLFTNTIGDKMWPTKKVTSEELDMTDPSGANPLDFLADAALKNPERFKKASPDCEKSSE